MNWVDLCELVFGLRPTFLSQNQFSAVFSHIGYIYKVSDNRPDTRLCHPDRIKIPLNDECRILNRLQGKMVVPVPVSFFNYGRFSFMKMRILGVADFTEWTPRLAFSYVENLQRLNSFGFQHNDAQTSNLRLSEFGEICLIDFDQCGEVEDANDILRGKCYQAREILKGDGYMHLNEMKELLKQAWHIARQSKASSPAEYLAYYSLKTFDYGSGDTYADTEGHFAGERDWLERWSYIRPALLEALDGDLANKRILELGSNMGLLSVWAAREGAQTTAVEYEQDITLASHLIAQAFEVDNRCIWLQGDLNHWQSDESYDVCTCLNVMYHVRNKQNLIDLLEKQKAVVYESHDGLAVETERLRAAGFENIKIICKSERGREVFLAVK